MACARLRAHWETFLDGELPSPETLELQTHLAACAECSEGVALSRAIRQSLQTVVQADALVSETFRARLTRTLHQEAALQRQALVPPRPRRQRPRRFADAQRLGLVALSSAAAVALWMHERNPGAGEARGPAPDKATEEAAMRPDEALDRLLDYHTAPPPPQVTEPRLLPVLERDVGVRVRLPSLAQYGAEWQGGSVINLRRNQPRAAYLRFRTPDAHNVTVYMYDPTRLPLHAVLKPRIFREEPVYEDYRRGFAVAAQVRHGVGYAVATDMESPLSAELVRAISTSAVAH